KRGRINRTGQILKPIYDYVTSAIPAEKRLMMMLQKKLKSLDANTASNQKQSSKILDVPDFLNKYGDKIVKDYLVENKEVNALLDDPLHLEAETVGSKVIKMGKGSDSAFGDDSNLETVRANVLKKPFSKVEVENLIQESLKGREAKMVQSDLAEDFVRYTDAALQSEYDEM